MLSLIFAWAVIAVWVVVVAVLVCSAAYIVFMELSDWDGWVEMARGIGKGIAALFLYLLILVVSAWALIRTGIAEVPPPTEKTTTVKP